MECSVADRLTNGHASPLKKIVNNGLMAKISNSDVMAGLFLPLSDEARKWSSLRGKVITLEGLIGVGKSTLGRSLVRYLTGLGFKAKFFPEFFHKPLLEQYLEDMAKYAYAFQAIMVRERIRIYREASRAAKKGTIAIVDRSLVGDISFATMQRAKNFISAKEWETYLALIKDEQIQSPALTIYLECTPAEAFQRMLERSISAEVGGYTLQYFTELEASYRTTIAKTKPPLKYVAWGQKVTTVAADDLPYLEDDTCQAVLMVMYSYFISL